jgi:hypothetical protein
VTVIYLLLAGLGVFLGIRRLKGLAGMKRTARSIKGLKEIATPEDEALPVLRPDRGPVTRDGT